MALGWDHLRFRSSEHLSSRHSDWSPTASSQQWKRTLSTYSQPDHHFCSRSRRKRLHLELGTGLESWYRTRASMYTLNKSLRRLLSKAFLKPRPMDENSQFTLNNKKNGVCRWQFLEFCMTTRTNTYNMLHVSVIARGVTCNWTNQNLVYLFIWS